MFFRYIQCKVTNPNLPVYKKSVWMNEAHSL